MTHEYEQREGLYRVSRDSAGTLVNVVFVHGLGGGGFSTWKGDDKDGLGFWPLRIAEKHPRCCVWTVHYTARILEWNPFARARTIDLLDRASWLMGHLEQARIASKPIVFVAHSLGGVVVKQALQFAQLLGPSDWRAVWEQTRAVFFIATPHVGSQLANVATRLADAARAAGPWSRLFLRPSPALRNLEKNNPPLRYLSDWYRDHAHVQGIETFAFAEHREYRGVMIVDESSANPQVPNRGPLPLAEDDHVSIAKPSHEGHPVYERLNDLLAEAARRGPMPTWPSPDRTTLVLRAENRALARQLLGDWWERHMNMDPAKVSLFSLVPDPLLDSIRFVGNGYNEQGEHVSTWNSVLARVERDREKNEIEVRYVWNGEYLASGEAARREVKFHGFAEYRFFIPADPLERITRGKGHYWNVDENAPEKTEFRRVELQRVVEEKVVQAMENEKEPERASRIREVLRTWRRESGGRFLPPVTSDE